jgi:hypothetical protein
MKTMFRLAMLFVAVMAIGCAGKSVNVKSDAKKLEGRETSFGEKSRLAVSGAGEYNSAGLPQAQEMVVLLADLAKQRLQERGFKVGDIGRSSALKDWKREGWDQFLSLSVDATKESGYELGYSLFGTHVGTGKLYMEFLAGIPLVLERDFPDQAALNKYVDGVTGKYGELKDTKHSKVDKKVAPIIIRGQYSDPASLYEGLQKELTPVVDQWIDAYLRFVREEVQSRP